MLSASPEQFNRLERILELVTEHERVFREQVGLHYVLGDLLIKTDQLKWTLQVHACFLLFLTLDQRLSPYGVSQDIRLADLLQKVTELDVRTTTETALFLSLKVGYIAVLALAGSACLAHVTFYAFYTLFTQTADSKQVSPNAKGQHHTVGVGCQHPHHMYSM